MKKIKQIIVIVLLGIPFKAISCDCETPKITDKFMSSEFVAKVKITNIYKNELNSDVYKADILIVDLFKGEANIKSIFIIGKNDGRMGNSCDIFIPNYTELIVYAKKNNHGQYTIGMCSGLIFINKKINSKDKKKLCREIDILNVFKSEGINFTNEIKFKNDGEIYEDLKKIKNVKTEKTFALYRIIFDENLNIQTIKTIQGFNSDIDYKILEIIKKSKWSSFNRGIKGKVPNNSNFLFGIYYYPKEKNNKSFFSTEYL